MSARPTFTIQDLDGNDVVLPCAMEVCDRCKGSGAHDHPAFSNGITANEWNGPDWDDESREDYLSGRYDVRCSECNGLRVVPVVDEDRLNPEQKQAWEDFLQTKHEEAAEARMRERGIEW